MPSTPTFLIQRASGSRLDTLQRLGVACIGTLITPKPLNFRACKSVCCS